jgi:hypothetical protein
MIDSIAGHDDGLVDPNSSLNASTSSERAEQVKSLVSGLSDTDRDTYEYKTKMIKARECLSNRKSAYDKGDLIVNATIDTALMAGGGVLGAASRGTRLLRLARKLGTGVKNRKIIRAALATGSLGLMGAAEVKDLVRSIDQCGSLDDKSFSSITQLVGDQMNDEISCKMNVTRVDMSAQNASCIEALVSAGLLPLSMMQFIPTKYLSKISDILNAHKFSDTELLDIERQVAKMKNLSDEPAQIMATVQEINGTYGGRRLLGQSQQRAILAIRSAGGKAELKKIAEAIELDPERFEGFIRKLDRLCP